MLTQAKKKDPIPHYLTVTKFLTEPPKYPCQLTIATGNHLHIRILVQNPQHFQFESANGFHYGVTLSKPLSLLLEGIRQEFPLAVEVGVGKGLTLLGEAGDWVILSTTESTELPASDTTLVRAYQKLCLYWRHWTTSGAASEQSLLSVQTMWLSCIQAVVAIDEVDTALHTPKAHT